MRPLPGDDTWSGRPRQRPNPQMSFFLADEASLDSHLDHRPIHPSPRHRDHQKRSSTRDLSPHSPLSRASAYSHSLASLPSPYSHIQPSISSRPVTPLMLDPSCDASAASTPSSRRNSVASSLSEIAISLNDESPDDPVTPMLDSATAPQLIMPSINMPSRRPYTETGKSLGRLKILVAGPAGVGKTSLLKAIVQSCNHIVHVDPLSGGSSRRNSLSDTLDSLSRQTITPTLNITEIHASTKPYPEWWSKLDTPRATQRRKSLGDGVLERNICFVDTPGYGMDTSVMETVMPCVDYVESYLSKVTTDELDDSDIMNMLGGGGGSQVDVVLYLISGSLKPADLEYMRRLAPLTNIIPVLARVDLLSAEQIVASKREIMMQLQSASISPFSFASDDREEQLPGKPSVPYTASSISIADHDEMDASLLMSSEYVQPLMRTDLAFLVEKIFSVDGASWLRHSAAKKYLQWRDAVPSRPRHLYRPLTPSRQMALLPISPSSLALARVQRREHEPSGTRLHLADWAADLQRSVMGERAWYETLSRGEQAVWLTEKVAECVKDGTLVARRPPQERESRTGRRRGRRRERGKTQHHQDPLGLLQVAADIKASGWVALEMAGGLGLIGTAVYVIGQNWQDVAVYDMVRDLVF
ncbi:hypothetical protein GGR57DRAFT_301857 [Xylariaceae sp. FL1272]|nr:hypothetical protein GGR57DRAFT_301857 [Xylariaceae sp. FL1272]